jgi:uncharacterized membrane protein YidH (DUF202 family)
MYRKLAAAVAVLAAFAFTCQAADAGSRKHVDKRVAATAIGMGAASTAAFFAYNDWKWDWNDSRTLSRAQTWGLVTVGCLAVSPIVATVVVKRPLTMREAHVLAGSCVVPIIGGWLVNAAYNANPQWEPAPVVVKKKRAKKKM